MSLFWIWVFIPGYAGAASWAVGAGRARLWATAASAVAFVVLGAVALGNAYSVPNPAQSVLAALLFFGPIIAVPTAVLDRGAGRATSYPSRFTRAALGAILGFATGWVTVVFGLGVW